MTHDDLISYFGSNKDAAQALLCAKCQISHGRSKRLGSPIQIRAFQLSGGQLQLDEKARRDYDYLMGRDIAA